MHGAAALAVWLSHLPQGYDGILLGLITLSWGYYFLRLSYRRSPWFIAQLSGSPTTGWQLQTGTGQQLQARLLRFYLLPWLLVLCFDVGHWRRCSVIACKDNIGVDALRRLRIVLLDTPKPLL